jgi:hypothetical protein
MTVLLLEINGRLTLDQQRQLRNKALWEPILRSIAPGARLFRVNVKSPLRKGGKVVRGTRGQRNERGR